MPTVVVTTRSQGLRRLAWGVGAGNLIFTAGTALFIYEWSHRGGHGSFGRAVISSVLVQFHLATENVLAAWYSSMLLLSVALAACLAYAVERRQNRTGVDRWLSAGWLLVAAAFAGLSLDEIGSFHERLGMVQRGAQAARGWVYALIVPILLTAAFLLAFAWVRLRHARGALGLFVVGIGLFLSNPVLELIEMSLLRGGARDLVVHNALLVIEEGIVELGGALCFLLAVLVYVRYAAGGGPHEFRIGHRRGLPIVAAVGVLLAAGVPFTHWFVRQLPPGDTGIPDNWFPAAALYGFALLHRTTQGRKGRPLAATALVLSAFFGTGLYSYTTWYSYDVLRQSLQTLLIVCFTVLCTLGARRQPVPSGALIAGAIAMACAIGVRGSHAATLATVAAACCSMGTLVLRSARKARSPVAPRPEDLARLPNL